MYKYILYICHFFVNSNVFRQCQWHKSCRSRRELSNAIVKGAVRLTGVEIWPFSFRKGVELYGNLQGGAGGTREKGTGGTEGGHRLDPAH